MNFSDQQVQFYPNRISVSTRRANNVVASLESKAGLSKRLENLKRSKSSVALSANSKRAIRDSIFSLYSLSKPRTVKSGASKFIYNFRQSFVTLTLPSPQQHSDIEIKQCLDAFLNNLRKRYGLTNYVWKAELQKNKNIHFHLSFDIFIHWRSVKYYWLLALRPLGYVDAYSRKFSQMSIYQYAKYRGKQVPEIANAYAYGVRTKWNNPNCIDVGSVTTASSVSHYLSKYFAKNEDNDLDEERLKAFGRVWARSQSLSRLEYKNKFHWSEIKQFIGRLTSSGAVHKVAYDYSTVFYINFKKLVGADLKFFNHIIKSNAKRYLYPFPVPV